MKSKQSSDLISLIKNTKGRLQLFCTDWRCNFILFVKIWSQKCSQEAAIGGKRWYSLGPTEHPLDSCTYGRYVRNSCVINIKNEDKLDFFQCTQAPRECWMGGDKCDLVFVLTTLPWQTFRNQTQINVLTCWSLYSWQRSINLN